MDLSLKEIVYDPIIGKIIFILFLLILLYVIIRFVRNYLGKFVKDNESKYRAKKFVNFFGYLLAVLVLFIAYSDKLGGLTVAFGVAGAGIAFALQEVIASIAGWIALIFAKFYKVGDRVLLGGIKGDVIDIGVLRTTIMECGDWVKGDLYNGRVVRIANSFVFKEPVYNYSADFPFLWDEIILPIRYGSDIDYVTSTLLKIAEDIVGDYSRDSAVAWEGLVEKFMIENAKVDPVVTIEANENWINFTIRYIVDYKMRRSTKNKIFVKILKEVDASQGKLIIAGATLEILEGSKITVKQV